MTKNKTKVILSDADIIGRKSAKILFSDQNTIEVLVIKSHKNSGAISFLNRDRKRILGFRKMSK